MLSVHARLLWVVRLRNLRWAKKAELSDGPYLLPLDLWPFWHAPIASHVKPPGMAKALSLQEQGGATFAHKHYSKRFCHKLVSLLRVFVEPPCCCASAFHHIVFSGHNAKVLDKVQGCLGKMGILFLNETCSLLSKEIGVFTMRLLTS